MCGKGRRPGGGPRSVFKQLFRAVMRGATALSPPRPPLFSSSQTPPPRGQIYAQPRGVPPNRPRLRFPLRADLTPTPLPDAPWDNLEFAIPSLLPRYFPVFPPPEPSPVWRDRNPPFLIRSLRVGGAAAEPPIAAFPSQPLLARCCPEPVPDPSARTARRKATCGAAPGSNAPPPREGRS